MAFAGAAVGVDFFGTVVVGSIFLVGVAGVAAAELPVPLEEFLLGVGGVATGVDFAVAAFLAAGGVTGFVACCFAGCFTDCFVADCLAAGVAAALVGAVGLAALVFLAAAAPLLVDAAADDVFGAAPFPALFAGCF